MLFSSLPLLPRWQVAWRCPGGGALLIAAELPGGC